MTRATNKRGQATRARAPLVSLLLFAYTGCTSPDGLTSDTSNDAPEAALSSKPVTGIPFGAFAQPLSMYGPIYTGGYLNPRQPELLLSTLATIRQAGGRVVLMFAGGPLAYTNPDGTFNFDLWKARIDRYRNVDFRSYIEDGTVIGHYVIDEPNCSTCWGGQVISQDVVEAMAAYSKAIWPDMITMARADPTWLDDFSGQYVSLDAGWSQYVTRKGTVESYLAANVAAAQSKGLGLIVGLNVLKGGSNLSSLTASQVKTFGSVLLGSPYPCAFISWQYDEAYFARSDIASAMAFLSKKANRHAASSCRR